MAKKKKVKAKHFNWLQHLLWVVPVLSILIYIPSFNADFTLDDVLIVEENRYVQSLDQLPEIWTSHYWAGKVDATDKGLYRPLTLSSYNIQYAVLGKNAAAFHMLNILLHALVCLVLMWVVKMLFKSQALAALSGLIFAIHPVHTEAVSGIVGRAEILAALFILLAMASYHRWVADGKIKWLAMLLLSTTAAITSKEHGFLIPAILVLQECYYFFSQSNYSFRQKRKWTGLALTIALTIAWWIFRSSITGPAAAHEMWANVSSMHRMATALRTTMEYTGMLLVPIHLSADYWIQEVPIAGITNPVVLLSILLIGGMVVSAVLIRRKWPVITWGILFFLMMLFPVSNFLFPAGFLKAERILYIPSIGFIVAMAALGLYLFQWNKAKIAVLAMGGVLLLYYAGKTFTRAADWKNNYTLSVATLKTSPDSPRFNNMMGLELRAQKKEEEAMAYFEKAVQSNPNHVPALVNLGLAYRNAHRPEEAAEVLEKALRLNPNTLATYVNLMSVYRSLNDNQKNLKVAKKALERYPQSAPIVWNAANAYQLTGDMETANTLRARAKALDPNIGAN